MAAVASIILDRRGPWQRVLFRDFCSQFEVIAPSCDRENIKSSKVFLQITIADFGGMLTLKWPPPVDLLGKACASSTTSTAPKPQPDPRAFVEAMLFATALKPLAQALGFMGEAVTGEVAQRLFLPPGSPHG